MSAAADPWEQPDYEVSETAREYEKLYHEISSSYAYLEQVLQQRFQRVDYLESAAASLKETEQ